MPLSLPYPFPQPHPTPAPPLQPSPGAMAGATTLTPVHCSTYHARSAPAAHLGHSGCTGVGCRCCCSCCLLHDGLNLEGGGQQVIRAAQQRHRQSKTQGRGKQRRGNRVAQLQRGKGQGCCPSGHLHSKDSKRGAEMSRGWTAPETNPPVAAAPLA